MFRSHLPERRRRSHELQRPARFSDLMEDFWRSPFESFPLSPFTRSEFPSIDLSEDDQKIEVKAEMPGLEAKDVNISVDKGILTLQGEKKLEDEEKRGNYRRIECSYGSFYRTIPLPSEVDENKIKAQYKNGILTIIMPKTEEYKAKQIEIET